MKRRTFFGALAGAATVVPIDLNAIKLDVPSCPMVEPEHHGPVIEGVFDLRPTAHVDGCLAGVSRHGVCDCGLRACR